VTTWVNILIGVFAVIVPVMIARRERRTKQLTCVKVSSSRIIPDAVADRWSVVADGAPVPGASTTAVRVVVTGTQAIVPSDFSTPLGIELKAVESIVAATVTRRRPADLAIQTTIEGPCVSVEPVLLNAGDMFEAQMLTTSVVTDVVLRGRVADTEFLNRRSLPYPPGSGPEGELLGFDRVMWYVMPVVLGGLVSWLVLAGDSARVSKAVAVIGIAGLVFVANPLLVRALDRRRGLSQT